MKCKRCGKKLKVKREPYDVDERGKIKIQTHGYCDACKLIYDVDLGYGCGLAGMILGILGIVFMCAISEAAVFMVLFPIAGLVISIVSLVRGESKKGFSITGVSTSSLAILIALVVMASGILYPSNNQDIERASDNNETNEKSKKTEEDSKKGDRDETAENGERKLKFSYNDGNCKFLEWKVEEDEFGDECLVLYFEFTNNNKENQAFGYLFSVQAFQNGVELDHSWVHVNEETRNNTREVQNGTTVTVAEAFEIGVDRSNVEIEITPFNIWSDKTLFEYEISLE